jgi:hypothetical protein
MSGERPDEAKEDEVDEGSQRARMLPISVNQTAESSFGAPQARRSTLLGVFIGQISGKGQAERAELVGVPRQVEDANRSHGLNHQGSDEQDRR